MRETEKVRKMREEGVRIKQQLERERVAVEESNRLRRDIIVEARAGVKIAEEKLNEAKKERAAALSREKEEQARRLAEEKALQYVRKQELIRQLRAIEAVPISEVTKYDPTTTAGQGLLEEMSLAELKERIQVGEFVPRHIFCYTGQAEGLSALDSFTHHAITSPRQWSNWFRLSSERGATDHLSHRLVSLGDKDSPGGGGWAEHVSLSRPRISVHH